MLFVTAILVAGYAYGAEVYLEEVDYPAGGDVVLVVLNGPIKQGDMGRVDKQVRHANNRGAVVAGLQLTSYGGDGDTGLALADYVSRHRMTVIMKGMCWSACAYPALVALGNGRLLIGPYAELGVHQVTDDRTKRADVPWTKRAARRLKGMGSPKGPLDSMVISVPSSMTIYEYNEIIALGATALGSGDGWWLWE